MTTIHCSKDCRFQTDGICYCDSILLSVADSTSIYDSECPYRRPNDNAQPDTAMHNNYL